MRGHFFGHAGRAPRRIQRERIEPDCAEQFLHLRPGQIAQHDAVVAGVGIVQIHAAGAGKLRVKIEAVTHIGHDQEGRAAFPGGQAVDVVFRLAARTGHRVFPRARAAADHGRSGEARQGQRSRSIELVLPLPGFQHEAALAVQVQAPQIVFPSPRGT